jgi:hypothetical protein
MTAAPPILVTGSHRSGSTWVGRMLAHAPGVVYLHEPFNADYYDPGTCGARFHYRFTYVTPANEAAYYPHLRRTTALVYNWRGALRAARGWRDVQAAWRMAADWRRRRRAGARLLMKDPLALLAAPWLAQRCGARVIVLIRHPAAFVSSILRFGWRSPLGELLAQPLLLRDTLHPFTAEIAAYAGEDVSLVEQAAVFWKMLYFIVARYREQQPDWTFVRHEDLSRAPGAGFRALCAAVDLPFTEALAAALAETTRAGNPAPRADDFGVARLDSAANIWSWKQRLTAAEVETVRHLAAPVADLFYTEADW